MIRELDKDEMKKLEQGELELVSGGVIIECPRYPGSGIYGLPVKSITKLNVPY